MSWLALLLACSGAGDTTDSVTSDGTGLVSTPWAGAWSARIDGVGSDGIAVCTGSFALLVDPDSDPDAAGTGFCGPVGTAPQTGSMEDFALSGDIGPSGIAGDFTATSGACAGSAGVFSLTTPDAETLEGTASDGCFWTFTIAATGGA